MRVVGGLVSWSAQSSVVETVDNISGPLPILVLAYAASVYEGCIVGSGAVVRIEAAWWCE